MRARPRWTSVSRFFSDRVWLVLAVAFFSSPACEQARTLEPTVNAKPGIEQVEGADDPIDEDVACEMLHEVLADKKQREDCDEVEVPDCPELIRPGGSLACIRYSESSVESCVEQVNDYGSCGDFVDEACIIVAIVDETTEGCVPPGPVDAGMGSEDAGTEPPPGEAEDAGSAPTGDAGQTDAAVGPPPMMDAASPPPDAAVATVPEAGTEAVDSGVTAEVLDSGTAGMAPDGGNVSDAGP